MFFQGSASPGDKQFEEIRQEYVEETGFLNTNKECILKWYSDRIFIDRMNLTNELKSRALDDRASHVVKEIKPRRESRFGKGDSSSTEIMETPINPITSETEAVSEEELDRNSSMEEFSNMPGVKSIHDSDGEDMDQETAESDKSSNEDTESTSGSGSDDGSSELDEEDCDKKLNECLSQMAEIERQFGHVKEQLYIERNSQVELRLEEVKIGTAIEYTQPLDDLHQNLKNRLEVAEILRDLKLVNIKHVYEAEQQAALQNLESEKALLWDSIKCDLEEKIRRLEEDRNSIDITSDLWNEQVNTRKNKRKTDSLYLGKRKKPVTVTGPYIVYMLHENDILEDWTTIRKALKASKQSSEYEFSAPEQRVSARFADGKLLFKGDCFRKGESVYVDDKIESPWPAHVISVNTSEVLLQKQDGSWSRICISDLQCGKYSIRHAVSQKL